MSHILLTYPVKILDLLTVTNYIRQNQTANFSASHSCFSLTISVRLFFVFCFLFSPINNHNYTHYILINNICPDYLKNYVSNTSDVSCRDTRSTNCNQLYTPKPNCELSCHSCTLEVSYGILSPLHVKHATWVNTFKSLYLKWKRLNGHCIISITTANLILYFVLI